MKILLAVEPRNAKSFEDQALRWVSRLGLQIRLFISKRKISDFMAAIDSANYHWYLDLQYVMLVTRTYPMSYAQQHGFDLLVTVPEDLVAWRRGRPFKDADVYLARSAIGKARAEFGKHPRKRTKKWSNGVTMQRVQK